MGILWECSDKNGNTIGINIGIACEYRDNAVGMPLEPSGNAVGMAWNTMGLLWE